MKKITLFFLLFFLSSVLTFANVNIDLKISPQKEFYATNETVNILLSCETDTQGDRGDLYVLVVGPGNVFYSITPNGVVQSIEPYYPNWEITYLSDENIFSFPYLDILRTTSFSLMAGIIQNGNIISNIATLQIPSTPPPPEEEQGEDNSTQQDTEQENSTLQQVIWNPIKTIAHEKYISPFSLKAGNNYIHGLGYKSNDGFYYLRIDNKGNLIVPPYKLEGLSGNAGEYRAAMVVDENDNTYIISTDRNSNFYLTKIGPQGQTKNTMELFQWENIYGRPKYLNAYLKNGKIYLTGEISRVTVVDKNDPLKKTVYENPIFLMIFDTDGDIILTPKVFSGQVIEYYNHQQTGSTDDIMAKNPVVAVDNNDNIHIFYEEKNEDLHTGYFLKYIKINLSNTNNSYIVPIKNIGINYSRDLNALFDKNSNSVFLTYVDKSLSPNKLSLLKIQQNTIYGPVYLPTTLDTMFYPHVVVDKFNNIDVYYYGGYHNNLFHIVVSLDDINNVVQGEQKVFENSISGVLITKDKDNNLHFISTGFGSAKNILYSNTNPDNSSFIDLPDIVVSPGNFHCNPSSNVDIGNSINCTFSVYNIGDVDISGINLSVKIDDDVLFSQTINLDAWSNEDISFIYSPQNVNTPEYPQVEISATSNAAETTEINNKITPKIHVKPIPEDVSFMVKVYDDTYDPDHEYTLPFIPDAVCNLYDRNTGEFISQSSSHRFYNIPIGESESSAAEYKIVCSKDGYNNSELDLDIWRDEEDPYNIKFSEHTPIKMYMNTWGTLIVDASYEDENGDIRSLSGFDLYIKSVDGLVNRHVDSSSSSYTANNLPSGNYTIILEKDGYERKVLSDVPIYVSTITQREIVTAKTDIGNVHVSITTTSGYIPDNILIVFRQGDNVIGSESVQNGEYEGRLEQGYYTIEVSAPGFETKTLSSQHIKAGVDNYISVELEPVTTPSDNREGYSRGQEVAILPYVKIEELPSSPYTDGYKVEWYTGQFKIKVDFIGEAENNEICSLNQVKIKLKGLPLYKAVVSSTWDPTSILDLPENIEEIYNAYSALPMAVTPDIPIGMAVATYDNTKVVIDKIRIFDDSDNTLFDQGVDLESDNTFLIDVNEEVASGSNLYMEIYMRIGRNDITEGFINDDLLYGLGVDHMKITYKVPRKKPEYGWYLYNPITGNETHLGESLDPGTSLSLGILKWKPLKPYSIDMEYLDPEEYNTETGL